MPIKEDAEEKSKKRDHDFGKKAKKDAWVRQGGRCACCGDDMERAAHKQGELPQAHHAVPNQSGEMSRKESQWMSSSSNCVFVCNDCHKHVHEDGRFRKGAVAGPEAFKYSHGDPKSENKKEAAEARKAHKEWSETVNGEWERKVERSRKAGLVAKEPTPKARKR